MRVPVAALTAMIFILFSTTGVVRYMTPFTTTGVVSKLAVIPVCTRATGDRLVTLPASICVSVE